MTDADPIAPPEAELERALARISERYRELVERLPAVVYEAEPGPRGVFRYVSPQIEELLGYRPREWTADSQLWLERLHPDDRDAALSREREHVAFARESEARVRSEYRMVHREGHTVCVRDEARLVADEAGKPVWHGVLIDITAARATSARLRAPGGDAVRANCAGCGASWVSERDGPCPQCGSGDTTAISLNETLAALAGARRQIENLLAAIHLHVDSLGDALHPPPGDGEAGG